MTRKIDFEALYQAHKDYDLGTSILSKCTYRPLWCPLHRYNDIQLFIIKWTMSRGPYTWSWEEIGSRVVAYIKRSPSAQFLATLDVEHVVLLSEHSMKPGCLLYQDPNFLEQYEKHLESAPRFDHQVLILGLLRSPSSAL